MNLLGHAVLSFGDTDILCGNMMGDFVKGKKILDAYPPKIRQGLILHRKIDTFTDNHPAVNLARNYYRKDYRLYSGAIIDVLFDHFLANDSRYFHDEQELREFTGNVFRQLDETIEHQTPTFRNLRDHLEKEKILNRFRTIDGLRTAIHKLCKRMFYPLDETRAYENTMLHYEELNRYYDEFIDDVELYARKEMESGF